MSVARDNLDRSVIVAMPDGFALDASRAGVEVPWREAFGTPPYTVEVWARRNGPEPIGSLAGFAPPAIRQRWRLLVTEKGQLLGELAGCEPWQVYSDARVTDDAWHHFALSFDGRTIRLFLDGQCVGERATTYKPDPTSHGPLVIGTCVHPGSMQASAATIRAARLSNVARTTFGDPSRDDATIGHWTFDATGVVGEGRIVSAPAGTSLDQLDAIAFSAGPAPMTAPSRAVALERGAWDPIRIDTISLDGRWQLASEGEEATRLAAVWPDAIDAQVPGSIHSALVHANLIPDPTVGRNDAIAKEMSHKTWWLRTTFPRPANGETRLRFAGVANRCTVWLNGKKLGDHTGMFGGPDFDVGDHLRETNDLLVRIDAVPRGHGWYWNSNETWRDTVTVNCVYGWHYVELPCLGIWQSVTLARPPKIVDPFVATTDAHAGTVELRVDLADAPRGRLLGTIEPENFAGPPHRFALDVDGPTLRASLTIPDPRPWWPNGLGEPNLYRLRLSLDFDGTIVDASETTFGLRTIEMRPMPDGPHPKRYNWQFVINGRPTFAKGSGWCTMDPLLDLRRERYERFLALARQQNVQMLRAWGGGLPETDDFYDLCDRLGIMVMQEWPTAWNSHAVQPIDAVEETVRRNTLRLRNRASLVMWGAGNESSAPHGEAIDRMGRLATELDGTRPFHRGEAWGGSDHNYDVWWGREPIDHNLAMTARFWGEFGVPSFPLEESVRRYLPERERDLWPPPAAGSFAHHTPVFDRYGEMDRFRQYAAGFTSGATMRRFIDATQLAQAVGVRHTLERARTRWPDCSGALMYKLNDVHPAGSWSTVDWYGATKLSHWFVRDAFAPLHACVLFESVNTVGMPLSLPVFLLDDADALAGVDWRVRVIAYDGRLQPIRSECFVGGGAIDRVRRVGTFALPAGRTDTSPLFVVTEVYRDGVRAGRTFYFVNYEAKPDCLFELPRTTLALHVDGDYATVTNTGDVPAACAVVARPGHLDTFEASDGGFWLEPGESRRVRVNASEGLAVEAWNAPAGK